MQCVFHEVILIQSDVEAIEVATCGQTESDLWCALHNGRLTSYRFGEILHRRPTTNPRHLVPDIMGYGGQPFKGYATKNSMGER